LKNRAKEHSENILVGTDLGFTTPQDVKNWLENGEKQLGTEVEEARASNGVLKETAKLGNFVNRNQKEVSYVCHTVLTDYSEDEEEAEWRLYEWSNEINALYPEKSDKPDYYVIAGTYNGSVDLDPREQADIFNYENSLAVKDREEYLINKGKVPENLMRDYKQSLDKNKEL